MVHYATKETKAGARMASIAFITLAILAVIFFDHIIVAVILLLMAVALVAHSYAKVTTEMRKYKILFIGFAVMGYAGVHRRAQLF